MAPAKGINSALAQEIDELQDEYKNPRAVGFGYPWDPLSKKDYFKQVRIYFLHSTF